MLETARRQSDGGQLIAFVFCARSCENTRTSSDQILIKKPAAHSLLPAKFFRIRPLLHLVILASGVAHADTGFSPEIRPLYSSNQNPLIQIYGLPALGEARVLAQGDSTLTMRLQVANNFTGARSASEYLNLDGETHRLTLAWRQGLADGKEWGFELPYLSHNGGYLDSSIERFHEIFGLPQNGRTATARNQINYRYTRNGADLVRVAQPVSGAGDLRLVAAKQIAADGHAAALHASLKLPTGRESELLGSGSTDLAVWLSMSTALMPDKWNLYGGGGILLMSEGNVLPSQQQSRVGFGSLGLGWKFLPRLAINAQLDAHTPFYDSSHFRQLHSYAVQGLLGVNWELAPRKFLEFSMSEDLIVDTSSDIVFNLSLALPF